MFTCNIIPNLNSFLSGLPLVTRRVTTGPYSKARSPVFIFLYTVLTFEFLSWGVKKEQGKGAGPHGQAAGGPSVTHSTSPTGANTHYPLWGCRHSTGPRAPVIPQDCWRAPITHRAVSFNKKLVYCNASHLPRTKDEPEFCGFPSSFSHYYSLPPPSFPTFLPCDFTVLSIFRIIPMM